MKKSTCARAHRRIKGMLAKTETADFLLIGVILLAVVVRVKVAAEVSVAYDELVYIPVGINYTQKLLSGDFNASSYSANYEHPDFAKLLIGLSVYLFTGRTNFPSAYVPEILISARFAGIFVSLIAILAVFLFGRKVLGSGSLGLTASAILALDPLFVYYGSIAYLDVPCSAFVSMSITLFAIAWKEKSVWKAVGSAVFMGLSISSKYLGLFSLMILATWLFSLFLIDLWSRQKKQMSPSECPQDFPNLKLLLHSRFFWAIIAYLPIAFLVFYLTDPYIWQNTIRHLRRSILFSVGHLQAGHGVALFERVSPNPPWYLWLVVLYTKTSEVQVILLTLGLPLLCLSVLKRRYGSLLLLLWFLIPLAFLSYSSVKLGHYSVTLIPQTSLISGMALQASAKKLTPILNAKLPRLPYKRFRCGRVKFVVVTALLIHSALIIPFYPYLDLYHNHLVGTAYVISAIGNPEGMHVAARWIVENIPEGSIIASSDRPFLSYYVENHFYKWIDLGPRINYTIQELRDKSVSYITVYRGWLTFSRHLGNPLYKEIIQLTPIYVVILKGENLVYIYKI